MVEIIGALVGFFSGITPDLFGFFKEKADRKHELEIMQLQMKQQAAGHHYKMREISAHADIAESKSIYKTYKTGINWIDAYNGTVRPTLAFAFFGLYLFVKVTIYQALGEINPDNVYIFWDDTDRAFLFGVLAYYFGQRGMAKVLRL